MHVATEIVHKKAIGLYLNNVTRSDEKQAYNLSTFPFLRAYNFLSGWSLFVAFVHNKKLPFLEPIGANSGEIRITILCTKLQACTRSCAVENAIQAPFCQTVLHSNKSYTLNCARIYKKCQGCAYIFQLQ